MPTYAQMVAQAAQANSRDVERPAMPAAPSTPAAPPAPSSPSAVAGAARKTQQAFLASPKAFNDLNHLTPYSKSMINKPTGLSPEGFSATKRALIKETLDSVSEGSTSRAARRLDFSKPTFKELNNAQSFGQMQEMFSGISDQHGRVFARELSKHNGATPIQRYSLLALREPSADAKADFMLFKTAVKDMSAVAIQSPDHIRNFLSGRPDLFGLDKKNILLTVVTFPGDIVLRFLSVSGKYQPPSNTDGMSLVEVQGKEPSGVSFKCYSMARASRSNLPPAGTHAAALYEASKPGQHKVFYLGYGDMCVRQGNRLKEWRGVPRLATHGRADHLHDRAKDTEYLVLSALSLLLRTKSNLIDLPMDIRMFSKLDMCSGCEGAANYASMQREFKGLRSFKIYGGLSNPKVN